VTLAGVSGQTRTVYPDTVHAACQREATNAIGNHEPRGCPNRPPERRNCLRECPEGIRCISWLMAEIRAIPNCRICACQETGVNAHASTQELEHRYREAKDVNLIRSATE